MKYSKDKKVSFDPEKHIYKLGEKQLTSVTTFISKFKNEFDSFYHSERIAKREGKTQEEILALWKAKANRSCEIGTAIHKIFEDYADKNYSIENGKLCFDCLPIPPEYIVEFESKKNVALQFINDFFQSGRLTPVYVEYIVYNEFLAGQIDMVCADKEGKHHIIDFKTNSTIDYESYNKKMKGNLSIYNDSNYWHYSLQLSIYKELIKEEIKSIHLIHITTEKYTIIECEDLLKTTPLKSLTL